jgi:hypothetical protein
MTVEDLESWVERMESTSEWEEKIDFRLLGI